MATLRCSIIINTYNREAYLRRLLPSLERLVGPPFEVIVVNGPSTDGTAAYVAEYGDRIKLIDCPERNLSKSRNLGIAAAAGDIVVFIDDDALPADPSWLAHFVDVFEHDQTGKIAAVGGPVLHRDTHWYEFRGGATSDYGFQKFQSDVHSTHAPDGSRWVNRIPGGNCAFRRDILMQIGGFDEFFVYYMDETDVCVRLDRAGYQIVYVPQSPIRHYSGASDVRGSAINRNWRLITRSDTYYAIKNSTGSRLRRVWNTIRFAPKKHFVREINGYLQERQITRSHWFELIKQWAAGVVDGIRAGLNQPRILGKFQQPAVFLLFQVDTHPKPLHIAILTRSTPLQQGYGGIARYSFDAAVALHARGHNVDIICADEQPIQYYALGLTIHGISQASIQAGSPHSPFALLDKNLRYSTAITRYLADLYRQGVVFDIVHASNWDVEALALIRANAYPTALMLVSPLAQVIQTEQWPINEDLQACVAMDRWQIEHAHTICVPSDGVLSSYRNLMGIDPNTLARLRKTALGIVYAPTARALPNKRKMLLFVGRCERRKGAHILLDALPALLRQHPDWECHFVGNDQVPLVEGGTLKENFLATYRQEPWCQRVIFHGAVAEARLYQFYASCDLFVAPSLFESFGLIYHEAMQYGKAVVGCATGGVPEVVEHGVEGLLVPPGDALALGEALARLMSNDHLREQIGRAGQERIRQRTNHQTMAQALEQVYHETIAAHAEECAAVRSSNWPREIALHGTHAEVCLSGSWEQREAFPGSIYLRGEAHATLEVQVPNNTLLRIVALRHAWSGILKISTGSGQIHYLDFYLPANAEPTYQADIAVGGLPGNTATVTLQVHSERNPASYESTVWLHSLQIIPQARSSE
ncbi:MAG: hypothetical protein Fur005_32580 [Roseiflexaceae bacterium]